jgi:DNA modification methylase
VAGGIIREEVIGKARLLLGDCRDILPSLERVDAVVTDPPYGIGAPKAIGPESSGWKQHERGDWDDSRPPREIFDAMRTVSREQIVWGGNYFTDFLPPTMRWLVWDKGQRGFSLADCEFAWSSQQKAARILDYPRGAANTSTGKEHPTQKPLKVMEWCLSFIPDAQNILDPFMGTGTTGVAAIKAGRSFIGVEVHEPYFEIACRRIREANGDDAGPLFGEAA